MLAAYFPLFLVTTIAFVIAWWAPVGGAHLEPDSPAPETSARILPLLVVLPCAALLLPWALTLSAQGCPESLTTIGHCVDHDAAAPVAGFLFFLAMLGIAVVHLAHRGAFSGESSYEAPPRSPFSLANKTVIVRSDAGDN